MDSDSYNMKSFKIKIMMKATIIPVPIPIFISLPLQYLATDL